jgi:branched-chain amino acid transport system permease protein
LFGSTLILGLTEAIKAWLPLILPQASGEQELILYGLILIVVMICRPDGVIGTLEQRRSRRRPTTDGQEPTRALERIDRTVEGQPAATVGGLSSE